MFKNKNITLFYILGIFFILGAMYMLLKKNDLYLVYCLSPLVLVVLFAAVLTPEILIFSVIFFTPLAVTLRELGISAAQQELDLSMPTEPLMAGLLLLTIFYQLYSGFIDKKILRHPITIAILIQLTWIGITCFTSEMPVVSIKFLIARLWFICTAFFLCSYLFKKENNLFKYMFLSIIPLAGVILFTLSKHSAEGFSEEVSGWVVSPFYNDHTAYSAAITMFVPVIVGFIFQKDYSKFNKGLFVFLLVVFLTGITFSYARAAWVSLAAAIALFVLLLLKIKLRTILLTTLTLVVLFLVFQTQILILLSKNDTSSNDKGDLGENLASITNIKTDASNVERLNRWNCALRMFEERPVMGWGPGTYMFQYAPFQKHNERTVISINDSSNGNSHSEYLGPLSEQGIPGLLCVIGILFTVFSTGFRLCYTLADKKLRILVFSVLLGLTTYFIHGFLNNFLDTDKLSVPFWGFIAILMSIDVYHNSEKPLAKN